MPILTWGLSNRLTLALWKSLKTRFIYSSYPLPKTQIPTKGHLCPLCFTMANAWYQCMSERSVLHQCQLLPVGTRTSNWCKNSGQYHGTSIDLILTLCWWQIVKIIYDVTNGCRKWPWQNHFGQKKSWLKKLWDQFDVYNWCHKKCHFWAMVGGQLISTVDIILMPIQHFLFTDLPFQSFNTNSN